MLDHLKAKKAQRPAECSPSPQPATVSVPELSHYYKCGHPGAVPGHRLIFCPECLAATPPPLAKKDKPAKPPAPRVVYQCGHYTTVEAFLHCPCPACRNTARAEKNAKKREKWEREQATTPTPEIGRLPAGAVKLLTWDGHQWTGFLTIKDADVPKLFTFTADSEKQCYHGLDSLYRAWLAAHGAAT